MASMIGENVEPQVQAYRDSVESSRDKWKRDHDDAMACLAVEDLLRVGVFVYDLLDAIDCRWRLLMAQGRVKYEDAAAKDIDRLFDLWLGPCAQVEEFVQDCESNGYTVELAANFRERHHRALSVRAERETKTD